ncbi:MAG: hypothetical protein ACI90V_003385 [Bacillariaceae sp.]|jgi:hypothetical protein
MNIKHYPKQYEGCALLKALKCHNFPFYYLVNAFLQVISLPCEQTQRNTTKLLDIIALVIKMIKLVD